MKKSNISNLAILKALTLRNIKLFFKDKGMFFTSLVTPGILLLLYSTFLGNVYKDSFLAAFPEGVKVAEKLINGCVGGQLISSILAVSTVTVAFCSNLLMVQDKSNGTIKDLSISPVKPSVLAVSYFVSNMVSTLIVCFSALAIGLVYIAIVGWYMTVWDVLLLVLDVILLALFGSALSSIVNFFLTSQGQGSAVGTIVSSCYGFISGAYMPISQFPEVLQKVIMFLPGTYGTVLLRNHAMQGAFSRMETDGLPQAVVDSAKDAMDINIYFFDNKVEIWAMYVVLCAAIVCLIAGYVLLNVLKGKKKR